MWVCWMTYRDRASIIRPAYSDVSVPLTEWCKFLHPCTPAASITRHAVYTAAGPQRRWPVNQICACARWVIASGREARVRVDTTLVVSVVNDDDVHDESVWSVEWGWAGRGYRSGRRGATMPWNSIISLVWFSWARWQTCDNLETKTSPMRWDSRTDGWMEGEEAGRLLKYESSWRWREILWMVFKTTVIFRR